MDFRAHDEIVTGRAKEVRLVGVARHAAEGDPEEAVLHDLDRVLEFGVRHYYLACSAFLSRVFGRGVRGLSAGQLRRD